MDEKDLAEKYREETALFDLDDGPDEDTVLVRPRTVKNPTIVYSIRIPLARVDELRRMAAGAGMDPSAMVRSWVLERLDRELAGPVEPGTIESHLGAMGELLDLMTRSVAAGKGNTAMTALAMAKTGGDTRKTKVAAPKKDRVSK